MSAKVQTYAQFAAERGLVTDFDVQGHIHGGLMAAHMPNSYHRRYKKRLLELQQAREDGKRLYREAVDAGEVSPPLELSSRELTEMRAQGHPDLASTQAAIRILERLNQKSGAAA